MKLIMIRHGEPCYTDVKELDLVSYLAQLTPLGVAQAEAVAKDERLQDADIIISSPFTRAMQTAAIISRETGIHMTVEPAFHEGLLDVTHRFTLEENFINASCKEFAAQNGVRNAYTRYRWESVRHIADRAYPAMKKYLHYNKVIVVAHATFIRTFGYSKQDLSYCHVFERDFDENSKFETFVPWIPKD